MAKKEKPVRVQMRLKVNNVNPRMERAGKDERGSLGVDVSLVGSVHLEDLGKLLKDTHAAALLEHMFDAEGNLQTPSFDLINVTTQVKDATIKLGEGKLQETLKDCTLDSITICPKPGRVFDFKSRLKTNPTPKQQSTIEFEFYKDTIKVIVEGGERVHDDEEDTGQSEMPLDNDGEKTSDEEVEA